MTISYNWLKQYIQIDLPPAEVAKILTNIGLEVEAIEKFQSVKGGMEGLVIGEVKTREKHPDADKLCVTTVDVGKPELLKIVCGAPNVEAGQKVVVATIGTTLFKGEENFKIKKSKIRGVESEGMICAEDEIGLGTSHEGILVLEKTASVGAWAKEYFKIEDDTIFEIGLTPNRIDAASHYGVARDLAAFLSQEKTVVLQKPNVENFKPDNNDLEIPVHIENTAACKRYSGVSLTGITVAESPAWLKNRLTAIGLRPINNVVDITNYVLHELGQPLHAFDADKIIGKKVIVKTLAEGSAFITLDEAKRSLTAEDLMICNAEEGMCIAGVFGGIGSGVTESTKNIFIESACFDPVYVRRTSKRHSLNTDSSFRFERGSDPNCTVPALMRAAILIKEIAGGKISSGIVDVYPKPVADFTLEVDFKNIYRLIGKQIDKEKIKSILRSLEIKIAGETPDGMTLQVPPFKVDVKTEADIVEEIIRIYGYNNIEFSERIVSSLAYLPKPDKEKINNLIADYLAANGFHEIMSNSLTKSAYYENRQEFSDQQSTINISTGSMQRNQQSAIDPSSLVKIFNPLSNDLNVMRQTLLFNGLEAISYNMNRQSHDLKLFEFGSCYFSDKKKAGALPYNEELRLALFITGMKGDAGWNLPAGHSTFYYLKAWVGNILRRLGIDGDSLPTLDLQSEIFDEGLAIKQGDSTLVAYGVVSKKIREEFDIKSPVFYADFDWQAVLDLTVNNKVSCRELPKYPLVERDLALLLDKNVRYGEVRKAAIETEKRFLKEVRLFDVFDDEEKLGQGKKSYAVRFVLQDEEKTLTDDRIDKIMNSFVKVFGERLGAVIR